MLAGFGAQMYWLWGRLRRRLVRDPYLVSVNLLAAIFVSLMLGMLYLHTGAWLICDGLVSDGTCQDGSPLSSP